jgi:S-adenosylmethionine synthetase
VPPLYEAECECGVTCDYLRSIDNCEDTPDCSDCGLKMKKVIRSAPYGYVNNRFDAFKSNVDGSIIKSKRDLNDHNKRNNVISLADGYSDDAIKKGYATKPTQTNTLKQDIGESIKMVSNGYKPQREVLND